MLLPEGLPLLLLDFGPARGVEEPLVVRSVHASSLLSPRIIRGLGILEALLRWTPATCSVPVGSPSSSLHALQGDGAGESSGTFSVLGCLSHLISARSARRASLPGGAPVRVLPASQSSPWEAGRLL